MKLKNIKNVTTAKKHLGFTLIELMISLALGTIVIAGLISVYVSTVVSSYDTIAMSKLSQQTSAVINIMTSDIRRAGYWGQGALTDEEYIDRSPAVNPFSISGVTALGLLDSADAEVTPGNSTETADCLAYTYDVNDDGILNNEDIVGFRLDGTVAQMRLEGTAAGATTKISCTDANGTWGDLTDSDIISVDALTFSLENSVCINNSDPDNRDCYTTKPIANSEDITTEVLQITINISTSLVSDSDVKMSMSQVVRVRNDRVIKW